ncbi:MAG: type II secretion system F family protein, partial [Planctomycetaceae bacterium]|nr:type II secretion system F family protein [Planctomycetaceae bacterium]
ELPWETRFVLTAGNVLRHYWHWIGLGLLVGGVVIWLVSRAVIDPEVRSRMVDLVPIVGPARRNLALARFCRMLSLLISGQTPTPEALRLAGATGDAGLSAWSQRLASEVEAGESPAEAVLREAAAPRWLGPLFRWHDRGPAFTEALDAAADLCVARSQSQLTLITLIAEPTVIVFVAILVGFAVLSLFFPLIRLLNELA